MAQIHADGDKRRCDSQSHGLLSPLLASLLITLTLVTACGGEPTPDPTAAAAATIIGQALSHDAPVSITVSPAQPPATPTPDRAATQTAEADRIATSVAATLTAAPTATKTPTPTPNLAATQTAESRRVATAVAATLTAAVPAPHSAKAGNFAACLDECATDRSNAQWSFPEGVIKLHVAFDYANFPRGAAYQRIWSMPDRGEWVRYDCIWPGPESGVTEVTLTEPEGLRSGDWEMTLVLNEEVLLRQQISVEGDWDFWDPAGVINNRCFGKE